MPGLTLIPRNVTQTISRVSPDVRFLSRTLGASNIFHGPAKDTVWGHLHSILRSFTLIEIMLIKLSGIRQLLRDSHRPTRAKTRNQDWKDSSPRGYKYRLGN